LEHFEAGTTSPRPLDVFQTEWKTAGQGEGAGGPGQNSQNGQQAILDNVLARLCSVEASLLCEAREHDGRHPGAGAGELAERMLPRGGGDRQSSAKRATGQTEQWLHVLVTKSGDAERRLLTLEKRLPKSLRDFEESLEEALSQLTTGVLKMAQLLGVASEDACEKLGWREACADLPRMMDHAWLRSRLPKRASVLKILRQKADAEQVRQLSEQVDSLLGHPSRPGPDGSAYHETDLVGRGMYNNVEANCGRSVGSKLVIPGVGSLLMAAPECAAVAETGRQSHISTPRGTPPKQTRPLSHRGQMGSRGMETSRPGSFAVLDAPQDVWAYDRPPMAPTASVSAGFANDSPGRPSTHALDARSSVGDGWAW